MDKRCDQFPNCNDFSDENNCNLITLGEGYVKDFTPFTLNAEGKILKMMLFVSVRSGHSNF